MRVRDSSRSPERRRRSSSSSSLGLVYGRPPTPYYPRTYRQRDMLEGGIMVAIYKSVTDFYTTRLCSMIYLLFFVVTAVSVVLSRDDALSVLPLSIYIFHHLQMIGTSITLALLALTHALIAMYDRVAILITLAHSVFFTILFYCKYECALSFEFSFVP